MATITASSRVSGQNGYGAPPLMDMMPLFSRGKFQLAFARSWSYNSTGNANVGSFTVPTLTSGQLAVYFVTLCSSFVQSIGANSYYTPMCNAQLTGSIDATMNLGTACSSYTYQFTNGQLMYPIATQAIGTSSSGNSGGTVTLYINNTTQYDGYPYSHINVVCFVHTPA
jgi:hypothetical protein